MTTEERNRHMEEGLGFKCHKKGLRLFLCRNGRARHRWNRHSLRSNDGGKAVLLANWSSRLHLRFVLKHCLRQRSSTHLRHLHRL
jgi:hypothetical protein